ncbi:hypothetical protein PCANC_17170 [Puccinia coronata f. sp. avenae]|uniref:Mediator of RNA polymerase II transcription subunit 11 n=1 Tax=Puccinia coronata f. sp. avenae TaxID=200324 RepID=A0A2N5SSC5_9BASI|nr:hypothetical protein PCANC_17170 [Puccinia coronata f. sp. avenae]PLW49278.1 hypothetical protein PCASD_02697 [Puccinia coronata f. sp. avenae]
MTSPASSTDSTFSSGSSSSIVFNPTSIEVQEQRASTAIGSAPTQAPTIVDPSIASSSQGTKLTLSGFTNDLSSQQQQPTQTTALTSPPATQPSLLSKPASLTAPSRGWMSQRRSKAVHIDDPHYHHHSIDQPFPSDHDPLTTTSSSSSQRIVELGIVEEQLGQLLLLASDVLGSLGPEFHDEESCKTAMASFSRSISDYFELLNKIQSRLRTSMSYLRVSRVSTRILFEPAHVSIPNCPVGLGDLSLATPAVAAGMKKRDAPSSMHRVDIPTQQLLLTQDDPDAEEDEGDQEPASTLSLGSLVAERNAWKDLVESLELIKAQRSVHT